MTNNDLLLNMSSSLARIEERVSAMNDIVSDVHKTVRGHNGDPGLVSLVEKINSRLEDVDKERGALAGRVSGDEAELEKTKSALLALQGEHDALKRMVTAHPSYLWLLHYKTKPTISVTIILFILITLFVRSIFVGTADEVLSRVSGILLSFFGVK